MGRGRAVIGGWLIRESKIDVRRNLHLDSDTLTQSPDITANPPSAASQNHRPTLRGHRTPLSPWLAVFWTRRVPCSSDQTRALGRSKSPCKILNLALTR